MTTDDQFDEDYYRRFYGYPMPRKTEVAETVRLGEYVCAFLRYAGQPVRRVLDLGCGMGLWRAVISRNFPRARYTGVEVSEVLCERYGWTHASITDYTARAPFDLVICSDVFQYLADGDAAKGIGNLARLCRGVLYFSALTRVDWEANCDRDRTDADVHKRSADWYRRRLRRHFRNAGGGLFVSPESPVVLWELETL